MKYFLVVLLCFIVEGNTFAQEQHVKKVDSLYKEDQFYAGVTYNLLGKKPMAISQSGFSLGFHLGIIKDMPINKKRNVAFGIGIGYSANSFNQNLLINKEANKVIYNVLDSDTYIRNKFANHLIEVPFELRWRTSSPLNYSFWRIYTGFKVGYVISQIAKYRGDLGSIKFHDVNDFNKFQYGFTFSVGYDTWNLNIYYGLNPIFKDSALLNGKQLDMNAIKIGIMFYFL